MSNLKIKICNLLRKTKKGVTVVELSVVLIIMSLLIAAFPTFVKVISYSKGRAIVRSITDLNSYVSTFRVQYTFLPGDIPNPATIPGSSALVAGNGDGRISWGSAGASANESLDAFQHLQAAGFISGISTDLIAPATNASVTTAKNIMKSTIDGSGLIMTSFKGTPAYYMFDNSDGRSVTIVVGGVGTALDAGNVAGTDTPSTGLFFNAGLVDPSVALQVDKSLDDGQSTTGDTKYSASASLTAIGYKLPIV